MFEKDSLLSNYPALRKEFFIYNLDAFFKRSKMIIYSEFKKN